MLLTEMEGLEVKKLNRGFGRNVYGLKLRDSEIGETDVNFVNKAFIIFNMEIKQKFRCKGYGEKFIKLLIEDIAKPEGCTTIITQWIDPSLVKPLMKRGFKEMKDEDYKKYPIQKNSSYIKEINLIKES